MSMDLDGSLALYPGWRQFASLPEAVSWARLRRHLANWTEARLIDTVCNLLSEATLDFTFRGTRFRIDEKEGRYRLFVEEGGGTDERTGEAARAVEAYCQELLTPTKPA